VFFVVNEGTFTYRRHRLAPTGTMLFHVLTLDNTRRFQDVFINTSELKNHDTTPQIVGKRT
jgi:hypothetical protein